MVFNAYASVLTLLHAGHDHSEDSGGYLSFLPDFGEQILLSGGIALVALGLYWVTNRSKA
ncbi:MAG: hypothetical protein ACOC9Y_06860 [Chloroflexota bacterium]